MIFVELSTHLSVIISYQKSQHELRTKHYTNLMTFLENFVGKPINIISLFNTSYLDNIAYYFNISTSQYTKTVAKGYPLYQNIQI
jgi:hypothetical protein